jgi:hypothetical protein
VRAAAIISRTSRNQKEQATESHGNSQKEIRFFVREYFCALPCDSVGYFFDSGYGDPKLRVLCVFAVNITQIPRNATLRSPLRGAASLNLCTRRNAADERLTLEGGMNTFSALKAAAKPALALTTSPFGLLSKLYSLQIGL